ncbi:hypothetical protein OEIGOIKO_00490 [Streptomyces chrestomyceticus JCM 4735]|uniref:Uncharacterized protein n=1 Tax=Streptomyces chrestomyceticus JCM 4735 TaxID=1306181 RepID=A0A7U9KQ86_9ACTN|nr:hypothetical protein [Streptomyces chrestomyceticus]GCD32773.1 hypothetical protein OEIGOIKO_00490 [Streptomyces chrestomyceticus JCM 4735]
MSHETVAPWTRRYLDAAVATLRAMAAEAPEHEVRDEDIARPSPLKHADLGHDPDTAGYAGSICYGFREAVERRRGTQCWRT